MDGKDFDEDNKNGLEENLSRWRSVISVVKNRRRRFRMVADLAKRSETEKKRVNMLEKIRIALYVQKAALQFMGAQQLEDVSSGEYVVTEAAEARRFQESVDDVRSTVKGHDVCQLLGKYKTRALAVLYVVMEAASFLLDLFGRNKRRILLAAFLLSVFGFGMSIYTYIMRRTRAATRVYRQKQLVRIVEIAFSVVQLVGTLVYFILAELGVKNNYSVSVFPLVFSIIVAVFTLTFDEEASDSSSHTDDNLSGDLPVSNATLIEAVTSTSNEHLPIEINADHLKLVRHVNMRHRLATTVSPASDHQLNLLCELPNVQIHMGNDIAAQKAIELTTFTRNEDAGASGSSSKLGTLTSDD